MKRTETLGGFKMYLDNWLRSSFMAMCVFFPSLIQDQWSELSICSPRRYICRWRRPSLGWKKKQPQNKSVRDSKNFKVGQLNNLVNSQKGIMHWWVHQYQKPWKTSVKKIKGRMAESLSWWKKPPSHHGDKSRIFSRRSSCQSSLQSKDGFMNVNTKDLQRGANLW